jgi:hypothetical protein
VGDDLDLLGLGGLGLGALRVHFLGHAVLLSSSGIRDTAPEGS